MKTEEEYIGKWIDTTLTLNEWLEFKIIDHWEIIDDLFLSDTKIEEIEQHQFQLFHECLNNVVYNKIDRLKNFDKVNVEALNEHLRVIELFLNSTEINPLIIERLRPIILINQSDYIPILRNFQLLTNQNYSDFRTDICINKKGKQTNSNYFNASILYEFKKKITKLLNTSPPQQIINTDIQDESDPDNPHARYFVNGWHWQLFKEWHENHVSKKLADYSFIFWVMYKDGFIYSDIGPTDFKEWLESNLNTGNLGKQLKQLRLSDTDNKYSLYTTLIDKYKLQSITLQKRSKNTTIT